MHGILADLRFTLRLMARNRWFSAAAIAALALGIGVNAVGFTIVNGAFLRGLPFEDRTGCSSSPGRHRSSRRTTLSYPDLRDGGTRAARSRAWRRGATTT